MTQRQPMFNVPRSVVVSLAVLGLVHLVRLALPREDGLYLLLTLAFVPARYAAGTPELPGGDIAAATSFLTYMLVHGDAMHLIVNGVWMLAFGSAIAQRVGDARFVLFSLACGVAGAALHLVLHFGELVPVVGASAAISGQMAGAIRFLFSASSHGFGADPAMLRLVPLAPIGETLRNPRILAFLAIWAGINFLFGTGVLRFGDAGGGIAWEAHIGGFAFGLLAFGLFDRPLRAPPTAPPSPPPTLH